MKTSKNKDLESTVYKGLFFLALALLVITALLMLADDPSEDEDSVPRKTVAKVVGERKSARPDAGEPAAKPRSAKISFKGKERAGNKNPGTKGDLAPGEVKTKCPGYYMKLKQKAADAPASGKLCMDCHER